MTPADLLSFLFIGLGNPGTQYEMTRHNMGFLVVEALAQRLGLSFKEDKRFHARVAKGAYKNHTVHLLLPLTYMNLSGQAVRRYVDYFKLSHQQLVVVIDDIALTFGQMRLRTMGSAGGHNGLKSIQSHLSTSQYMRLRMGIGHPGQKHLADYVLEPFSQTEKQQLATFIDQAVEVLLCLLTEDPLQVMNKVNTVPRPPKQIQAPEKEPIDLTKPPLQG